MPKTWKSNQGECNSTRLLVEQYQIVTLKKIYKLFVEFRKYILKHAINFDDLSQIEQ